MCLCRRFISTSQQSEIFFSQFLQNKKLHSLIRQLSATLIYCFNLLTIDNAINCPLFFLFLHKKGLLLCANICSLTRDWSIVWIWWINFVTYQLCSHNSTEWSVYFPYFTQQRPFEWSFWSSIMIYTKDSWNIMVFPISNFAEHYPNSLQIKDFIPSGPRSAGQYT